jgi:hypothetical protein
MNAWDVGRERLEQNKREMTNNILPPPILYIVISSKEMTVDDGAKDKSEVGSCWKR